MLCSLHKNTPFIPARIHRAIMFTILGCALSSPAYAALNIPITVNLSETVNVTGTPRIAVDVGGTTRYATYTSGTGSNALTFTLAPQAGDVDLDGVTVSSPIDLNGGTIKDVKGNNAALTFTPPGTTHVKVNYPSLGMDFVYDADGRYTLNGTAYNDLSSFLTAAGGSFTRASIGTYFDSTGTLQTAASGVPRFDYDPVTHAAKGILIEESRTNYIPNSSIVGGTSGTPGIVPTGWRTAGSAYTPLTRVLSYGTENGIPYIDISLSGTPTNASHGYYFSDTTIIPAASGQSWTTSFYAKLISGDGDTNVDMKVHIAGRDSGGTQLETSTTIFVPTSDMTRYKVTRTMTNALTAYMTGAITFTWTIGQPVNFTVRLMAPQIEQGSFPTSYIPTTTAAVTRAADSLIIPIGSWFNESEGTITTQGSIPYLGGSSFPTTAGFASDNNNRMMLYISDASSTDKKSAQIKVGGTYDFQYDSGVYSAGDLLKQGLSYASNNSIAAMDGILSSVDNTVVIPTVSNLYLGKAYTSQYHLNGTMQKLKYYPTRVTDTQLQLLTQ